MAYPTGLKWVIQSPRIGTQPITTVQPTPQHPLGLKVSAVDSMNTYGVGEFVYVGGAVNGALGSTTTYAGVTGTLAAPIATGQYGWAQVSGVVPS